MNASKNTPLVSVILPVYNQEQFISETIDSILAQTFKNFELIILDDGSTDGTRTIIEDYTQRDHRIKAYYHSNVGRGPATNKAVSFSNGKYCALIDADDLMLPDRLEKQLSFHQENPQIDASAGHCAYIDEKGRGIGTQRYNGLESEEACRKAMQRREIIHCAITTLMITRTAFDAIGGFDKMYWPCDDLEIANRIIENGYFLIIIQDILVKYRIHQRSETASKQWHLFQVASFTYNNLSLRKQGQEIITFKEYQAVEKAAPFRKKIKLKAHRYAIIYHKKAGFSYHKKNYLKFAFQLFFAAILDKGYVITSIKKKLSPSH